MTLQKYFLLLALLLNYFLLQATPLIPPVNNLSNLCKTWGYLKYYHPQVNTGTLNWDSVLVASISEFDQELDPKAFNQKIAQLINTAGPIKYVSADLSKASSNPALKWLLDSSTLSKENKALLISLVNQYNQRGSYYAQFPEDENTVSFANEQQYADMQFPDKGYRLLALFRAWNAANYFFPYKKHMDQDLDRVLDQLIVEMKHAQDTLAYHGILKKFSSALCDSHANLSASKYLFSQYPNTTDAWARYVAGKFVFYEGDVQGLIKPGDVLLKIDGKEVNILADSLRQYWNASNEVVTMSGLSYFLLSGKMDTLHIEVQRDDKQVELRVPRSKSQNLAQGNEPPMQLLAQNEVAYFKNSPPDDSLFVDSLYVLAKAKKGIIIDLRGNYPLTHFPITSFHFFPEIKPWAIVKVPDQSSPGKFTTSQRNYWQAYGSKFSPNFFRGPVVVLVDEFTQSHLEFISMYLKQRPNTTVIGSQTSGADGNTVRMLLPGGFKLVFTNLEVLWPNGAQTQRKGIEPDIYVAPTIESIKEGRDLPLETAVNFILKKSKAKEAAGAGKGSSQR